MITPVFFLGGGAGADVMARQAFFMIVFSPSTVVMRPWLLVCLAYIVVASGNSLLSRNPFLHDVPKIIAGGFSYGMES